MNTQVIQPLEGEEGAVPSVAVPKPTSNVGRNVAIIGGMVVALSAVGFGVAHFLRHKSVDVADSKTDTSGPATAQPIPLKMPTAASAAELGTVPSASAPASAPGQVGVVVPSLAAQEGEATPIALRGAQPGAVGYDATARGGERPSTRPRAIDPDDAPMFATSSTGTTGATYATNGTSEQQPGGSQPDAAGAAQNNLNALKGQLGGLMETLQRRVAGQGGSAALPTPTALGLQPNQAQAKPGLFGSMEQSATPTVSAHQLGNLSLMVPKGTLFLCSLKTRVITATSGFVACQSERNVLSADGKVSLIDRGAHLDGEYRVVTIKPGVTAVPVIWTRIRTSNGVYVDLDSPATDQLGASGLTGYVDNRWGERIGASVLLSLIQDAVQYATTSKSDSGSNNVILPNTSGQGSKLAEKVLDATINIPPLLYQNQGGVVGVYVARDLNFASVYELHPK